MSTAKVINIVHPSGSTTNIVNDASGNVAVGNNLTVAGTSTVTGTVVMGSSFKRNRIINGNMGVWQRGTSGFTTTGNYAADRWFVTASTSLSAVAQSTDVPSGYKYSISINGTNYPSMFQRIESVNTTDLVGQSVTISFWLKQTVGAGAASIAVYLSYPSATDNYTSSTNISPTQYLTATSSWAQYVLTVSSLPSGVANGLQLGFAAQGSGAATFYVTGVQLEVGTKATPYEMQIYSDQLAQCQRYYYQTTPSFCTLYGFANATGWVGSLVKFPVTMRVTPTMAVVGTWTGSNASGVNLAGVSPDGVSLYTEANSTGNLILYPPASGPGITASAEL